MKVYTDLYNRTKNYSLTEDIIFTLKELHGIEIVTEFDKSVEIYWGDRFKIEYFNHMPNIKWIHLSKTGVDKFVFPKNVLVTNTPSSSAGVDEYALSIILFFLRNINELQSMTASDSLNRQTFDKFIPTTTMFRDTSCLIVGSGRVGSGLNVMLNSIGFKTSVVNRHEFPSLNEIVKSFDFVVNCLPLNNETNMCFDKIVFQNMKSTSIFINIGRGETVNEFDLLNALEMNSIRAAFLDVVCDEPISVDSRLLKLKNLFISPHIANATKSMLQIQIDEFVTNFKKYKKNKPLNNIVKQND